MSLSTLTVDGLFSVIIDNIDTKAEVVSFINKYNLGVANPDLSRLKNLNSIQANILSKSEGLVDMIEFVINKYYARHPNAGETDFLDNKINDIHDDYPEFTRNLKNDGFVIRDKKVIRAVPKAIESAETQDELDLYLTKFSFETAKGHLNQAIDNIKEKNWAAANAMTRSFFESVLIGMVKKIDTTSTINSGNAAINFLAEKEFFKKSLNEIDDKNTAYGFIKGLWKMLHPEGSHPGLSDEGDSTFRYHLILVTTTYYLKRLEEFIK